MSKRIVILGAGESGVGAAILAAAKGFDVFVSDAGAIMDKYKKELTDYSITYEEGKHTEELILNADEVIKSPGIPHKAEMVKKLMQQNTPIISEIEFAWRYTDATIVGITGSNGKSTTTSLTYHILKKGGLNVAMGGNIGKSFARLVAEGTFDYYVLELSSFQLDDCVKFRPHISILLNITPDHLDRYEYVFENYINSKFSITKNQTAEDHFIYCLDDEVMMKHINNYTINANKIPFSISKKVEEGAYLEQNTLIIDLKKTRVTMETNELSLTGKHNLYNSMAAGIAGRVLEIRKEIVRESLQDFHSLEHRLEFISKVSGVEYINDSKATNVNSTWYALESMSAPVIWIAGGVDKGNDYAVLQDLVRKKVKAIVALGTDNRKIHEAFSKHVDLIINTTSMKEAVKMAQHLANNGEVVLLSPACASFDLFQNYEDRGRQFKEAVREL